MFSSKACSWSVSHFFVQAAIRGHPINCFLRSNMTCFAWFLECWPGLGRKSQGVFLQPGFLDELAAFEKSPRSSRGKKQQAGNSKASAQCIWVSSCSQSAFGRLPTGNSWWHGSCGLGNDFFSPLEIKNVITSLCYKLFWKRVWFDLSQPLGNRSWFQVEKGRRLWTQDWFCAPWK